MTSDGLNHIFWTACLIIVLLLAQYDINIGILGALIMISTLS